MYVPRIITRIRYIHGADPADVAATAFQPHPRPSVRYAVIALCDGVRAPRHTATTSGGVVLVGAGGCWSLFAAGCLFT